MLASDALNNRIQKLRAELRNIEKEYTSLDASLPVEIEKLEEKHQLELRQWEQKQSLLEAELSRTNTEMLAKQEKLKVSLEVIIGQF